MNLFSFSSYQIYHISGAGSPKYLAIFPPSPPYSPPASQSRSRLSLPAPPLVGTRAGRQGQGTQGGNNSGIM